MMSTSSARQARIAVAYLVTFLGSFTAGTIPCDEANLTAAADRLCELIGARQMTLEVATRDGQVIVVTGKGANEAQELEQWRFTLRKSLPKLVSKFDLQRVVLSITFANGFTAQRDYPYSH